MPLDYAADNRYTRLLECLRKAEAFQPEPLAPEGHRESVDRCMATLPLLPWHERSYRRSYDVYGLDRFPLYCLSYTTMAAEIIEEPHDVGANAEPMPEVASIAELESLIPSGYESGEFLVRLHGTAQERACPECWGEGTADVDSDEPCPFCGGTGRIQRWTAYRCRYSPQENRDWAAFPHHFLNVAAGLAPEVHATPLGTFSLEVGGGTVNVSLTEKAEEWTGFDALATFLEQDFQRARQEVTSLKTSLPVRQTVYVSRAHGLMAIVHRWRNWEVFLHPESTQAYSRGRPISPLALALGGLALGFVFGMLLK